MESRRAGVTQPIFRSASKKESARIRAQVVSLRVHYFGGGVVLELARMNVGLASVVAFHPEFTNLSDRDERSISCKVMVCAGADDPLIPAAAREKFIELMDASGADWQLLVYSRAAHSFTDRGINALGMKGFFYHAPTDRRSWAAMRDLLAEAPGRL
jgi:dienelactone hydrolase